MRNFMLYFWKKKQKASFIFLGILKVFKVNLIFYVYI